MLEETLNIISIIATFLVANIVIYVLLNFIFGRIWVLNIELNKFIKIKDLVFYFFGTFIILFYFDFYQPH